MAQTALIIQGPPNNLDADTLAALVQARAARWVVVWVPPPTLDGITEGKLLREHGERALRGARTSAFHRSRLGRALRKRKVSTLVLAGPPVQTSATARDATLLGFDVRPLDAMAPPLRSPSGVRTMPLPV